MNTSKVLLALIVLVIVLFGGWYFLLSTGGTLPVVNSTVPSTSTVAPVTVPTVNMGLNGSQNQTNTGQNVIPPIVKISSDSKLGSYLVSTNGMTLYTYAKDTAGVSNCSGVCATNWPAYSFAANEPVFPGDSVKGQIGTIARSDGSVQLTYNKAPLYFWKNDTKPGDATGQGVGGVWFVVKP